MSTDFSDAELERYARQLALPELGPRRQARLRSAQVLVVGAGALAFPAAAYLVGAGAGRLAIVDPAPVRTADLQLQLLHLTPDLGRNKAESAAAKLGLLNPEVQVDSYPALLDEQNAEAVIAGHDVVADCSNSPSTAALVNEACLALGIPLLAAGISGLLGWVAALRPGESACYRCAFPEAQATAPAAGALGPVAGVVGSIQALEAIRLLAGIGSPLLDRVLRIDARDLSFELREVARRKDCPSCAGAESKLQAAL